MWQLITFSLLQCILLSGGQVFLKFAMMKTDDFNWSWNYFYNLLTNWQFMACGICYGAGSILWMYIIKNFPFSLAYPMISLSYIIGMFSAIIFFHEEVTYTKWIGVLLIMGGCCLIVK